MVAFAAGNSLSTTEVLGLLRACPWTQSNPAKCTLHDARKLPLVELYGLIRQASTAELEELVASCESCPCRCRGDGYA